ncbi:DUF1640 domain-containing protein [Desulfovibrio sp. ZJ369]|uniref:DUF1640 domain-containing protein n=1 Tax=Desulfovibrio sp. ZJ369 TaxID=2709793 RepID=UPI001981C538|nr:DUF1640 domain-containing protein [Desulfovibrio sp. ZJ369]
MANAFLTEAVKMAISEYRQQEAIMTATTFDTLGYFEKLKAAGFTEEQAKAQASALREIIEERLVTKGDLVQMELRLTSEMQKLELRMTLKLGAMLAASIAIVAALVKLL